VLLGQPGLPLEITLEERRPVHLGVASELVLHRVGTAPLRFPILSITGFLRPEGDGP